MAFGDRICDVSAPPAGFGLTALASGNGNGAVNTSRFQAMVNAFITNNRDVARAIYFPPGIWCLGGTIIFPNANSWYMFGGGGMGKGNTDLQAANGGASTIRWEGGTVGPMFDINESDGMVWERLILDGKLGCEKRSGAAHLDQLINFNANSNGFFHEFKNCTFYRAQRLWYVQNSSLSGPAELTFHKCMFNCYEGETVDNKWTSQAFYTDENQCVNIHCIACEFNNVAICMKTAPTGPAGNQGPGGRFTMRDCTCAITGLLFDIDGGSQNTGGMVADHIHIDGQGPAGRTRYYKGRDSQGNATGGNVIFRQLMPGSQMGLEDEFATMTSFNGTNLTLATGLRMRIGDRVAFVLQTDRDSKAGKIEGWISDRLSDTSYTVSASPTVQTPVSGVGISTHYCCCGEALIECVSSELVTLEDSYLTARNMQNGRLFRGTHATNGGGRSPKFISKRCMGFITTGHSQASLENLLTLTGTCYWRFEDADGIGDAAGAPLTVGNFGISGGGGGTTVIIKVVNDIRIQRKYATAGTEYFMLYDPSTGLPVTGVTFTPGDATISKDGGAFTNTSLNPTSIGNGLYQITLTASEKTALQSVVKIVDQTVPAVFSPVTFTIDLYGNASALHEFDLDAALVSLATDGISSAALSTAAIDKLESHQFATEDYAADGIRPSLRQALNLVLANFQGKMNGVKFEAKKLDGVSVAAEYTVNDSANPTEKIRTL